VLGKAETGALGIVHSVTILVKPFLCPPPILILTSPSFALQTNMDEGCSIPFASFTISSPGRSAAVYAYDECDTASHSDIFRAKIFTRGGF
jgi:hypothetical protein